MITMVVEKLEHSRIKLTFDVTADEFEKALDKAFEVKNKEVTIKGFRAGKAPRAVFEKNYGVESLFPEAIDQILGSKVEEVIKDEKLTKTFVGKFEPEITDEIERGKDFHVSLLMDVMPEFDLPQYKGIEVKAQKLNATPKEVKTAIEALTKKDAKMVTKEDQTIEKHDFAVFDFVGSVDGVEFEGGKAENYELEIGSGQFIPGFEDQMIGMKAGEEKDLDVKFPKNYQAEDLAGKKAVFHVTVHEVKQNVMPELTDEYVKTLNVEGAETLKDLKKIKKAEIEAQKVISEKDRQVNDILNKIIESANIDMPRALIDERKNQMRAQYENQAKMYNIPFETFVQFMGVTIEQFDDQIEKAALNQALFNLIASKIVEVENLTPTKEQVEAKATEDSKANGKTMEENLQANVARYYSELAYDALVNMLLENCVEI